ncbi:inositol monophosphatase, partial [Xanthomonas citri pv. citri]|nr:inositol monophosphatase [Xanthomonas citri pv. citri]
AVTRPSSADGTAHPDWMVAGDVDAAALAAVTGETA